MAVSAPQGLRRHPWNRDFTWVPAAPPFTVLTSEQAAAFDRHGFVVVPDVLDAATLAAVTAEIDTIEAAVEAELRRRDGQRFAIAEAGAITFAPHLVARSERLRTLSAHPFFVGVCADLVGPDVNLYWDQAVYKKPEKPRRFPWHQDNGYAFVEPQQYLTCWVALTDATEDNGCPWVVPGLHRKGTLAHEYSDIGFVCLRDPEDAVAAAAPRGSIVVFSSLTPHSTGPNRTDRVRKAYIVQYAPSGAVVVRRGPDGPLQRVPADDPARQYEILRGGERVTVP